MTHAWLKQAWVVRCLANACNNVYAAMEHTT